MNLVPGLDGKIIRDYEEFQALKTDWNDLLHRSDIISAWLTHEWLDCWWRSFGTSARLFVPTARQQGRLVAAAPMMIVQERIKGIKCKGLRFMENGITPRSQFLVARDADGDTNSGMKALWHLIRSASNEWDFVSLANVPEEGSSYATWQAALAAVDLRWIQFPDRQSPFIDLSEGYQAFRMTLSRNMRRNLNSSRNGLSRLGTVSVRPVPGTNEIPEALETCIAISARSWKAEVGSNLGGRLRPAYPSFYHALAQNNDLRKRLYIWILQVNDRPIAFDMSIRSERNVSGLATDYDLAFRKCSPGFYLLAQVLEQLPTLGVTRYDMSGGTYDYELSWTNQSLSHTQFLVFHRGARSLLLHGGKTLRDALRGRLQGSAPT